MTAREEIELAFVAAGWEVAGLSSPHLVAGNAGGVPLSIRAYGPFIGGSDEPPFELVDRLLELEPDVPEPDIPAPDVPTSAPAVPAPSSGADCSTGASNVPVVPGSKGDGDGIACEKR